LKAFKTRFSEKGSDVTIISDSRNANLRTKKSFHYHRNNLEKYVKKDSLFLKSRN